MFSEIDHIFTHPQPSVSVEWALGLGQLPNEPRPLSYFDAMQRKKLAMEHTGEVGKLWGCWEQGIDLQEWRGRLAFQGQQYMILLNATALCLKVLLICHGPGVRGKRVPERTGTYVGWLDNTRHRPPPSSVLYGMSLGLSDDDWGRADSVSAAQQGSPGYQQDIRRLVSVSAHNSFHILNPIWDIKPDYYFIT